MPRNPLQDLFNRVYWRGVEGRAALSFRVRCRQGKAELFTRHDAAEVVAVVRRGLILRDGTFLPFHRIVEVTLDGCAVWPPRRAP